MREWEQEIKHLRNDAVTLAMVWYQLDLPSAREIPTPKWYRHSFAQPYFTAEEIRELNGLSPYRIDFTAEDRR